MLLGTSKRHVARPRLTEVVAAHRVTVVEAGAGYGKSALAAECAANLSAVTANARLDSRDSDLDLFVIRLRRAFRLAGLSDLAAVANSDPHQAIDELLVVMAEMTEPLLLVIDDVHSGESHALAGVLFDLASALPARHRLLILGRDLAGPAKRLRYAHDVAVLTAADLTFQPDELAAVLAVHGAEKGELRDAVMQATGGWPAAVVLVARQLARNADQTDLFERMSPSQNPVVSLVQLVLDDLSAADRSAAIQLAHLPLLSAHVTAAVSDDGSLWGRLTAAGLPISSAIEATTEFPGPIRDYLVSLAPLEAAVARQAAHAYCELGEIRSAIDVLSLASDHSVLAGVIADQSHRASPLLEFSEIAGVVDALPADVVDAYPRVLLVLARLAGRAERFVDRFVLLTRLEALTAPTRDRRLVDELHIEVALDLLRLHRGDEAAERVEGMAARLTSAEISTRARLLAIEGRCAHRYGDHGTAARLLTEAVRLALQMGDRDHAAMSTYTLASEVLYEAGRLDEALAAANQSLALASTPVQRLARLSLIADLATDVGRYDDAEAALAEQSALLRRHRSERWAAYVPWGHARIASQTGDLVRTTRAIADVEQRCDQEWFVDEMKAVFFADASDMLGRLGETASARKYIDAALAIWDGHPCSMFDAMLEARGGDPAEAARKFAALPEHRERREDWRMLMLRAFALFRAGDPGAGELAADAFDRAAADGLSTSLAARESVVARQLAALAAEAGSVSARELSAGELPWTITLFGGFEVRRGGLSLALAAGKPTQAIKVVAVLGGRATLDEVVDALWPDQDLDIGRRGVRNLLNRLKPFAPDLLQRDGNDLVLNSSASVDVDSFEREAHLALSAPQGDPARGSLARAAIARYRGELLPSDRYEAWATLPRERARRKFVELIELSIDEAESRGDTDEAVRLCERAIEADPYDERRYVRAVHLLEGCGRQSHARAVVGRAQVMLEELDLEPTRELRDLALRLNK